MNNRCCGVAFKHCLAFEKIFSNRRHLKLTQQFVFVDTFISYRFWLFSGKPMK